MKLVELIDVADGGYGDGVVRAYYDEGAQGDGLAEFVVDEITSTFDENAEDLAQYQEAMRVVEKAMDDLQNVYHALDMASRGLGFGNRG